MDTNIRAARFLAKTMMMKSAVRSRSAKLHDKEITTDSSKNEKKTQSSSSSALDRFTKSKQTTLYEKVEKSSDDLSVNIDKMLELGKKTDIEEKDKDTMTAYINEFVSDYNTLYSSLNSLSDTLSSVFRDQLGKITDSYAKELEKLGITIADNGELTIAADTAGGYADEINGKLGIISKSASSSLESMDNLYGTGLYDKYGNNAYYNNW